MYTANSILNTITFDSGQYTIPFTINITSNESPIFSVDITLLRDQGDLGLASMATELVETFVPLWNENFNDNIEALTISITNNLGVLNTRIEDEIN